MRSVCFNKKRKCAKEISAEQLWTKYMKEDDDHYERNKLRWYNQREGKRAYIAKQMMKE